MEVERYVHVVIKQDSLPCTCYSGCLNSLLREIVSEITLTDSSTTTTSLLRSMCHHDDCVLLGSWLEETDHQDVEEMVRASERMNELVYWNWYCAA